MVATIPPRKSSLKGPDEVALATLYAFEQIGVAVFPEKPGTKGTHVNGWPFMPVGRALQLSRAAANRGPTNLAGRTGNGIAVLDPDGKDVDPERLLPVLEDRLRDSIIAVVRTARGFHIWVAVVEGVGNGFCSALGGEVFSEPHLAMLPPSLHPEGIEYEWVTPPREPPARADLRALGLVPDDPTFGGEKPSKLTPAPAATQDLFAELMAAAGIGRGHRVQALVRCPWHDDRQESLSINWEAAVFHCFGESCKAKGGVGALAKRLGKHTPTYRQEEVASSDGNLGCAEEEAKRLVAALKRLGQSDKAQKITDCKKVFAVGRCASCATSPVYPITCGHPLCPICMRGRLAADWKEHEGVIPEDLTLIRLVPRDFWGTERSAIRKVRSRFGAWRERAGVAAGLYGIRLDRTNGAVVLLAIPSGIPVPASSRAFEVQVVSEGQSPEDYLHWLQDEYSDEARSWETDEDLAELLAQTRRRRRFQGFGGAYGPRGEESSTKPEPSEKSPPQVELRKVSGGSHSKGSTRKDIRLCPACGGRVEMYDFTVRAEEVQLRDGQLQWVGQRSRAPAAA